MNGWRSRRDRRGYPAGVAVSRKLRRCSDVLAENPRVAGGDAKQRKGGTLRLAPVVLPVPERCDADAECLGESCLREIRIAASIHWYQQGAISMERAAEAAGMSRREFLAELARRRVDVFVVDPTDLERELRNA